MNTVLWAPPRGDLSGDAAATTSENAMATLLVELRSDVHQLHEDLADLKFCAILIIWFLLVGLAMRGFE